jgi:hypothetical protein
VTSYFEVSVETNLMVQSEFNLIFWFVSYNIFSIIYQVGPMLCSLTSALSLSREKTAAAAGHARFGGRSLCSVCFTGSSATNFIRYTSTWKVAAAFTGIGAVRLTIQSYIKKDKFCKQLFTIWSLYCNNIAIPTSHQFASNWTVK